MLTIECLGERKNADVLKQFVDLQDKKVIDIGCGDLTFSKILVDQGAEVLAIDPDPRQAAINRASAPIAHLRFEEAGAEHLPAEPESIDGVFFSYSLHHIDSSKYPSIFEELSRVLKPEGFVFVIEPIDCPFNQVMRHFHNEDAERAAAWDVLENSWAKAFQSSCAVEYHSIVLYDDFDAFAKRFGNRTFNPGYTYQDVVAEPVRAEFEKQGKPTENGIEFSSPKRAVFLSGGRA